MNWWAIFAAGLLAGATTCAASQGGLLVGLIARQKREAAIAPSPRGGSTGTGRGTAPTVAQTANFADDFVPVSGFLAGKLLSHTLLGAMLGALGALIDLDARIGGSAQLLAGAMMIVLGLSTLGAPGFRKIVITPPASWLRVARRSTRSSSAAAPFMLGLATVLVPCGVTVSIMILASASGSAMAGAAVMFVFVLGTAPMFGVFGFLTQRYAGSDNRVLGAALGTVVLVLGLVTLNAGLVVLGSPVTAQTIASSVRGGGAAAVAAPAPPVKDGVQTLVVDAHSDGFYPGAVSAKAGVPTRLVLRTEDTRSCILSVVVPSKGLSAQLPTTGQTTLDLGTLEVGEVAYACSMGMYTGSIVVT